MSTSLVVVFLVRGILHTLVWFCVLGGFANFTKTVITDRHRWMLAAFIGFDIGVLTTF